MKKTLPRIELRRPSPQRYAAEAAEVAALYLAARRAALPGLRQVHTDEETTAWIREEVFPRRSIFLAVFRNEIVGFAARDGAWLDQLYVKPGWTGHGIGRTLLEAVIAEAAAVTPVLRLHTFQRNAGARRFYERHGFLISSLGDGSGNEEGEPDLRYERSLR